MFDNVFDNINPCPMFICIFKAAIVHAVFYAHNLIHAHLYKAQGIVSCLLSLKTYQRFRNRTMIYSHNLIRMQGYKDRPEC